MKIECNLRIEGRLGYSVDQRHEWNNFSEGQVACHVRNRQLYHLKILIDNLEILSLTVHASYPFSKGRNTGYCKTTRHATAVLLDSRKLMSTPPIR